MHAHECVCVCTRKTDRQTPQANAYVQAPKIFRKYSLKCVWRKERTYGLRPPLK